MHREPIVGQCAARAATMQHTELRRGYPLAPGVGEEGYREASPWEFTYFARHAERVHTVEFHAPKVSLPTRGVKDTPPGHIHALLTLLASPSAAQRCVEKDAVRCPLFRVLKTVNGSKSHL